MNHRRIVLLLAALLLSVSCDKKTKATKQNQAPKRDLESAVFTTMDGRIHQSGQKEPYTGKVIDRHASGAMAKESHYKVGRLEGLQTVWHANGQVHSKLSYGNGAGEGLEEVWYASGKMAAQSHYLAGILHGATITWYSNGTSRSRVEFKSGLKNGAEEAWYENGNASRKGEWRDGRPHGTIAEWYPNGKMLSATVYHLGKKNGVTRGWHSDGKPTFEEIYKDDQLTSKVLWNPDGSRSTVETKKLAKNNAWKADQLKSYYLGQSDALVVDTFGMPDSTRDGWWNYEKMKITPPSPSTNLSTTNLSGTNLYTILRLQLKGGKVAQVDFSR